MIEILINTKKAKDKIFVEVESVAQASKAWTLYRNKHNLGASDMSSGNGNLYKDGELFGHISYNGRAWDCNNK